MWTREIEKGLRRFDASLQWLMERITLRDEDIDAIKRNDEMAENEKCQLLRAKSAKSISDVLEEVGVLIDTHFFNEFSETKSSQFLKIIAQRGSIETSILKKTWRKLNCTPKMMKIVREIQENLLCVEKERIDHEEEDGNELLLQPDWDAAQREAHHQLLQEGLQRDQRPA